MDKIKQTLDYINSQTNDLKVDAAIVLGSGLGCFCDGIDDGIKIKYEQIPGFCSTSIKGHKGELLFCQINGKNCAIMQGRFHYYEGNSMQDITYPIKILKLLGANTLIITNAAGSLDKKYIPGDILAINDHINFMGTNPLVGKNDETLGERFPDMSECYSKRLIEIAKKCAKDLGIDLKEGVYVATTGPSYETKAEVKAFKILGADVVGMSSVPEAIVANYLKMKTLALSMITNYATGIKDNKLSHNEVLEIGKSSGAKMTKLIKSIISKI